MMFREAIHRLRTILSILKIIFSSGLTVDLGAILSEYNVGGLVLDLAAGGSGSGPKVLGENIVALDISIDEIKEAIKSGAQAWWICADGKMTPFRDGVFDYVITFYGLMFIYKKENKKRILKENLRVLKKNSKMLLVEPIIKKEMGSYFAKIRVLDRGDFLHETCFGISGKGIKQTLELLREFAAENDIPLRYTETEHYFVAVLTKS